MKKSVMEGYEPFPLRTVNPSKVNALMGVFGKCSLMPGSRGAGQQDDGVEMGMGEDPSLCCSLPAPGLSACG